MSDVTRYSDMQIADALTRFRMATKGNTVPDTEMWVRAIDYDALRAEIEQWKKVYALRGQALARPCINCGHVPAIIKCAAAPEAGAKKENKT